MQSTARPIGRTFLALVTGAAILMQPIVGPAQAQAQDTSQQSRIEGLSRQPTPEAAAALFDANDAVLLLLDHQTGLFQTVNDIPVDDLRRNTVALAKIAELAGIPIIYTAYEPDGPNGPIMEELAAAAPNAVYVGCQGEVSACGRGAPVTNLSHSASFHSLERITPLNRGIEHLGAG